MGFEICEKITAKFASIQIFFSASMLLQPLILEAHTSASLPCGLREHDLEEFK